jgi:hypothetical protein
VSRRAASAPRALGGTPGRGGCEGVSRSRTVGLVWQPREHDDGSLGRQSEMSKESWSRSAGLRWSQGDAGDPQAAHASRSRNTRRIRSAHAPARRVRSAAGDSRDHAGPGSGARRTTAWAAWCQRQSPHPIPHQHPRTGRGERGLEGRSEAPIPVRGTLEGMNTDSPGRGSPHLKTGRVKALVGSKCPPPL